MVIKPTKKSWKLKLKLEQLLPVAATHRCLLIKSNWTYANITRDWIEGLGTVRIKMRVLHVMRKMCLKGTTLEDKVYILAL